MTNIGDDTSPLDLDEWQEGITFEDGSDCGGGKVIGLYVVTNESNETKSRLAHAAAYAAGLEEGHELRVRSAITHLAQAGGVDLPTVKRISGHKTLAMVERYSHQNGDRIRSAMDKMESRYHKNR